MTDKPPAAFVTLDPAYKQDTDLAYAFFSPVPDVIEPPGARARTQVVRAPSGEVFGLLVGPLPSVAGLTGYLPDGTRTSPLWVSQIGGLAEQRKGKEVGEVRFQLPRRARTPHNHVTGGARAGSDLVSYTRLNAQDWVRRQGHVEAENIKVTRLRPGLLEAEVTLSGRGSLIVLLVPQGGDWTRGIRAVSGHWYTAQERFWRVQLAAPPGPWRVLALAGNEVYHDEASASALVDPADDVYAPVDLTQLGTGRLGTAVDVTLNRPGACVVALVARQALTPHVHPRYGVRTASPEGSFAVAAAWAGGAPRTLHHAQLSALPGEYRLLAFGAPFILQADLDPWT